MNPLPYPEVVRAAADAVQAHVPPGRVVAVASRGDEEIVRFPRHRGWHFPQGAFGLYAGHHPADDTEAIDALESLRRRGAGFLLFPSTSFWWFDHYAGFAEHLQLHYRLVHHDACCRLYDLAVSTEPAGDETAPSPRMEEGEPVWEGLPLSPRIPTVVIPVHNAREDVARCLASVAAHTARPRQVLVIDDASTDPGIARLLTDTARRDETVRLLRLPVNRGYTAAVNLGCRAAPGDVVLLNSDTLVTEGWLEKLAACAHSRPEVATVTPLSNAAGAFSVPRNHAVNELAGGWTLDGMAELVERRSALIRPVVPTGNGFCLYITRRALNAVGGFDEQHFPRGYGEENDFCMRARRFGLVNLIDDATYVYHRQSASFGEERAALLARSGQTLRRLHPTYKAEITAWLARDPLDPFRVVLERAVAAGPSAPASPGKPCVLYVLHDGRGGTPLTSEDLVRELSTDLHGLVLRTGMDHWTLSEFRDGTLVPVRRYTFSAGWRYPESMDAERAAVLPRLLRSYGVALVHVRHLLGNGPELIEQAAAAGVPVVFSFHDFYTACPTIQLVDDQGRFCGGRCTPGEGDCPVARSWFPQGTPPLKHRHVQVHRQRMAEALRRCDAWVTTSASARDLLRDLFPFLGEGDFRVIEHGRALERDNLAVPPRPESPARVVCLGNLDRNKGAGLIEQIMALDASARRFEFHFVGGLLPSFRPDLRGGICHGPYRREDLGAILRAIGPSFSLIASIWPETYCHTLTESWAAGIPVFASRLGATGERVAAHGGGWLLDPADAASWYAGMVRVLEQPDEYARALAEIRHMPLRDAATMAADYLDLYGPCLMRRGRGVR